MRRAIVGEYDSKYKQRYERVRNVFNPSFTGDFYANLPIGVEQAKVIADNSDGRNVKVNQLTDLKAAEALARGKKLKYLNVNQVSYECLDALARDSKIEYLKVWMMEEQNKSLQLVLHWLEEGSLKEVHFFDESILVMEGEVNYLLLERMLDSGQISIEYGNSGGRTENQFRMISSIKRL